MLIALTCASGRTDASHASLLAEHAAFVANGRATLRPAAQVVAAHSSDPDVMVVAFRNLAGGLAAVVYNAGTAEHRIGLTLDGMVINYMLPSNAAVTFVSRPGLDDR